ncbi:beta-propeller fold lactonase family protein [Engelhardtia mirabilis]|uniref:6-phosphogluconolactonase n=1 Tax=Engelhardtia mirabilis TaxID=2528011 RepID=A0A518BQ84_9BACT|nr:6-phosphogluconolactonase [Planctomycetes bacterium Pla133]QDV03461.1 6-phosphogluconolactonase [Planctomycetes bacterium Pla86]
MLPTLALLLSPAVLAPLPQVDPQLSLVSVAKVGEGLDYQLDGTLAGPGVPEFLLIDFSVLPFPVNLGDVGVLHLAASPLLSIIQGNGSHVWNLSVPNEPVLTGLTVHAQGLGFVFDGVSGILRLSNLVSVVLAAPDPSPRFAFVANENDDTVSLLLVKPSTAKLRHAGYRVVGDRPIDLVAASDSYLYVLCAGAKQVQGFAVDPVNGSLAPLPVAALGAGADPRDMVIDPGNNHLYVSDAASDAIFGYAIAGNGSLVALPGSPFTVSGSGIGAQGVAGLAIDEQDRFLMATCSLTNKLSVFNIDAGGLPYGEQTGNTGAGPISVAALYQDDPEPRAIVVSQAAGIANSYLIAPDGKPALAGFASLGATSNPVQVTAGRFASADVAYVCSEAFDTVVRIPLTSQGALGAATVELVGDGPQGLLLAPDADFAIAVYGNLNELSSATIASDGSLTPIAPAESPTDRIRARSGPRAVEVVRGNGGASWSSDRVYVASRLSKQLSQFSIDGTASIVAPLLPASAATAGQPNDVAVHPRQDYAYVANYLQSGGADLQVFDISINGQAVLTQSLDLGTSGESSQWTVEAGPGGQLVIAADTSGSQVVPLLVGPGGVLTAGLPAATGAVPRGATIDPTGRFYYIANSLDGTLSQYALDPASGQMSPLVPPTVTTGAAPFAVAADPTGRFIYVVNQAGNTISGYAITPQTGVLTAIAGSPFATGAKPSALAIDPSGRFLVCANEFDRTLTRFALNLNASDGIADGSLIALGAVPVIDLPRGVAFTASGKHLLVSLDVTTVGGGAVDRLATYIFNAGAGAILTLVDEDATGLQPRGIATRDRIH